MATVIQTLFNYQNILKSNENKSSSFLDKIEENNDILLDTAPSGSGYDNGTKLVSISTGAGKESIVFETAFHHMNSLGYYCGWTTHTVKVTPSFIGGFTVKVGGRNKNDIKDKIAEDFHYWLSSNFDTESLTIK